MKRTGLCKGCTVEVCMGIWTMCDRHVFGESVIVALEIAMSRLVWTYGFCLTKG